MGGEFSGKSTLIKTLFNYATKNLWSPIYCELEPKFNDISFPGILSALITNEFFPYHNEEIDHISYFFGTNDIDQKESYYVQIVKTLIKSIE